MTLFYRWIPTFTGAFVLMIVGLILRASIRRDERRAREARARGTSDVPGGAPTA